jgi:hypothetical protein
MSEDCVVLFAIEAARIQLRAAMVMAADELNLFGRRRKTQCTRALEILQHQAKLSISQQRLGIPFEPLGWLGPSPFSLISYGKLALQLSVFNLRHVLSGMHRQRKSINDCIPSVYPYNRTQNFSESNDA